MWGGGAELPELFVVLVLSDLGRNEAGPEHGVGLGKSLVEL